MIAFFARTLNDFVEVDRHDGKGFVTPSLNPAWPSTASRITGTVKWAPLARSVAARFPQFGAFGRLPLFPQLLAFVYTESSGNAAAKGAAGEIGLCQIMPSTAALYGVTDPARLADPETNLLVCARLLSRLTADTSESLPAVASMYNAGPAEHGNGIIGPKHRTPSTAYPWGFVEAPGYIASIVSSYNYFLNRFEHARTSYSPNPTPGFSGASLWLVGLGLASLFMRKRS